MTFRAWAFLIVLLAAGFAGCLSGGDAAKAATAITQPFHTVFRVFDASSDRPIFLAQVTILVAQAPIVAVATDQNGTAPVEVPAKAASYEVSATGFALQRGGFDRPVDAVIVRLKPLSDATEVFAGSGLTFRLPVDLGSKKYLFAVGTSCITDDTLGDRDGDCGLSEPGVEVDGAGAIYVTGVCCIGNAPPVYVSRDDGQSFKELTTPTGIRERFGIEGDFAIDAQGVIYFADIELAATFQVTAWTKDGQYLRHTKWPAPPLVDRDWIRAEGNGKLYYVYNTGSSTNVFTSQDGGATWSPRPVFTAPYGLGNAIKGLAAGELWVVGGAGKRRLDVTTDGGATWRTEMSTAPSGGGMPSGAFDEAGNLYLTGGIQDQVYITRRDASGQWNEPVMVSPNVGHHRMAWAAAGGPGKVAVAWYGTLDEKTDAKWHLFVAASLDADQPYSHWQVAIADPEPVVVGTLGRQLLDFLQVEIGPDGAIHVAYAKLRPNQGNNEEQLHYVHSEPTLPMAAMKYANGPIVVNG